MRRAKATLIYGITRSQRAVQLRADYSKFGSTVRYQGIKVGDALELYQQSEI